MKKTNILKLNDNVVILPYQDDPKNREGRIEKIDPTKGYFVCNMNMPYYGVIHEWFKENQLRKNRKYPWNQL